MVFRKKKTAEVVEETVSEAADEAVAEEATVVDPPVKAPARRSGDYLPCPVCGTHLTGAVCAVDGYRKDSANG
jgi:hypothetical protein